MTQELEERLDQMPINWIDRCQTGKCEKLFVHKLRSTFVMQAHLFTNFLYTNSEWKKKK